MAGAIGLLPGKRAHDVAKFGDGVITTPILCITFARCLNYSIHKPTQKVENMAPDYPPHPTDCMCDSCIHERTRSRLAREAEIRERDRRERAAQDYIRRRGGVDPRRSGDTEGKAK